MAVKYTNNAKTTLASGLTNSATSATVTDGSAFPSLGAGEYFYITFDDGNNNEIAKVTARSGNTLTIVRAQDNTSARAFSTGDSAELRVIAAVLTEIQENIAAKSANQTVYSATAASNATDYNIGVDPGVEANASVFLDGVYQHHDTFSFSGSTLTFDAAPTNGTKIEVVVDNLINLQSSNLTVDTFTATSGQTAFTLSDAPGGESNVLAFIDGVFQNQASFTLSSNTLTFDTGVVVGRSVTVYIINPVNIGTPSDNTVTSAKLSGNITLPGSLTVGAYDVAFDSPTFVVDHTNSRVGLGTSSPSVPVDIVGEAKISSHFTFADDAELRLGNSSDVKFKHHNSGYGHLENTGILYVDSEQVIFRTDNSSIANALTLDASHNATFAGTIASGDITSSGNISLGGADGNNAVLSLTANTGNWVFTNVQANRNLEISDSDGTGTVFTIDTSGNVGISATPSDYFGGADNLVVKQASGEGGISVVTGDDTTGYLLFADGTSGDAQYRGQVAYKHGTNEKMIVASTAELSLRSGSSRAEAVLIDSNQKVGVGNAPVVSFDVSSTAFGLPNTSGTTANGMVRIGYNDRTWSGNEIMLGIINASSQNYAGYIQSKVPTDLSANRPFLINPQGGNVGINGDTPANALHVFGGASDSRMQFTNNATGNAYADGLWVGIDSTQAYLIHRENTPIAFYTNAVKRMSLDASGDLSISDNTVSTGIGQFQNTGITSTTSAAASWSITTNSGTYNDVGSLEVAGIANRHVYKWGFSGDLSSGTWYPFAKRSELVAYGPDTGSGSEDGFAMYFRIYIYTSSSGWGEYFSNRMTNLCWLHSASSNSNSEQHFIVGPGLGHAPNGGQGFPASGTSISPVEMRIHHRYGSGDAPNSDQTFEIKLPSAFTGLNPTVAGRQLLIYGYIL